MVNQSGLSNIFKHKKSKGGKRGGRSNNQTSATLNNYFSPQAIIGKAKLAKYNGDNVRLIVRNLINSSTTEVVLEIGLLLGLKLDCYLKVHDAKNITLANIVVGCECITLGRVPHAGTN